MSNTSDNSDNYFTAETGSIVSVGAMDHEFDFLVKPMATDAATSTNRMACPSEDDEGFRTPTSPRHRIPTPKQCPPAPGRGIAPRKKIGKPSDHARRLRLALDLSSEVEELFPPATIRKNFQGKIEKNPVPVADMDAQFDFLVKPRAAANSTSVQEDGTSTNGTTSPCEPNNAVRINDDDDEGFKTPTSPSQRIPAVPKQCPPTPIRPRVIPPRRKIRKPISPRSRRLLLDLSNEALFPPPTAIIRKIEPAFKVVTAEEDVENKLS